MLDFDPRCVPFSRAGSHLALCETTDRFQTKPGPVEHGLWLRTLLGQAVREVVRIEGWQSDGVVQTENRGTPGFLELRAGEGSVRFAIVLPTTVRIRGEGLGVRLKLRGGWSNCAQPGRDGSWVFMAESAMRQYLVTVHEGVLQVDAEWNGPVGDGATANLTPDKATRVLDATIDECEGSPPARTAARDFAVVSGEASEAFDRFRQSYGAVPAEDEQTAALAAYVTWSSLVEPGGRLTRPAMFSSKNWMAGVWSWDHCFNALALAAGDPDLAWDQLMVVFDSQLPNGQLPDYVNDTVRLCTWVKPPVHGWVLTRMLEVQPSLSRSRLEEVYEPLMRWTNWWLDERVLDDSGLPRYFHGYDSGWDNATVFDVGQAVVTPDLSAYLVLQCEALGDIAERLGRGEEAAPWRARAADLQERLIGQLWGGNGFHARNAVTGEAVEQPSCLLNHMPIVLGERLPAGMADRLATTIRKHLTAWGLATERPDSPLYESDGYWRGPIWAPSTALVIDGLRRVGISDLPEEIARRYRRLCTQSGFAECFDAETGASLRDPALTWTASVFLWLAHGVVERTEGCGRRESR